MDVAWQEGVGSFLDSSGTDLSGTFASFGSGDGGTLWSSAADSTVFSDQSLLWESGADAPADSHLSGLTADNAGGTDTGSLLAGGWIADGTPGFGGGVLGTGLLWAGAGSETSSSLTNGSGVGLGALDLGTASGATQWQQFVNDFAGQPGTWLTEAPQQLLWAGASSQPQITVPLLDASQSLHLAASDSSPSSNPGTLSPTQLVWAQPSAATGLVTGPSLTDAAPTPVMSGAGIVGSFSSNLPIAAGVGSHA